MILVIVLFESSRRFVLGGFFNLEQTLARKNIQRVVNNLNQNIVEMDSFADDRAATDDAYDTLPRSNTEFARELFWQGLLMNTIDTPV